MLSTRTRTVGALALACGVLALAQSAAATPVTVNLRVEGQDKTLFEGPITTDAYTATTPVNGIPGADSSPPHAVAQHPCDFKDNGSNGGYPPYASDPTPTTALYDATRQLNLPFGATWYSSLNDFFVNSVGPDQGASGWGFAVNRTTSSAGGCQTGLATGNDLLWASDFFSKSHLLALSGPGTADVGHPITVTVTDGASGAAFAGATVGAPSTDGHGNPTVTYAAATDSHGTARVTFTATGVQSLKAFHNSDSVRSNRLDVCVHAGNDGTCGTALAAPGSSSGPAPSSPGTTPAPRRPHRSPPPPQGRLLGIADGHFFHGRGPRLLLGSVFTYRPGLRQVNLRIERQLGHGSCQAYDAGARRLRRIRCGATHAPWFSVGAARTFALHLAFPLPRGHYVVDVEAVDRRGRRDDRLQRGRNRVTFWVV